MKKAKKKSRRPGGGCGHYGARYFHGDAGPFCAKCSVHENDLLRHGNLWQAHKANGLSTEYFFLLENEWYGCYSSQLSGLEGLLVNRVH